MKCVFLFFCFFFFFFLFFFVFFLFFVVFFCSGGGAGVGGNRVATFFAKEVPSLLSIRYFCGYLFYLSVFPFGVGVLMWI